MSSISVPFLLGQNDAALKLLELPEELLQVLESETPPTLEIKTDSTAGFAVICLQDQTFQIRQQQTSNSLFVTESRLDGICTIASCSTILELAASSETAVGYLKHLLKTYDAESASTRVDGYSKDFIYANIPLSRNQIDYEWNDLSAFESSGVCYLPTFSYLLQTWKHILETAYAERVNLLDNSQHDHLWQILSEDDIPLELFLAITSRVEREELVSWIARTILQNHDGNTMSRNDFTGTLKDLLPSGIKLTDDDLTAFEKFADLGDPSFISLKTTATADSKSMSSVKLSWHEKFKNKR